MGTNTREEWLTNAVDALRPVFYEAGLSIPAKVKVSCGWPSKKALASPVTGKRALGQCFASATSAEGYNEIFISPVLDDAIAVLDVLVHELVHAADDCVHGHRGPFASMARAVGLEGKLTSTHAGPELLAALNALNLPPYPHASVDVNRAGLPKQSTRLIKVACGECGYPVRVTRVWLTKAGAPVCPMHGVAMSIKQSLIASMKEEQ